MLVTEVLPAADHAEPAFWVNTDVQLPIHCIASARKLPLKVKERGCPRSAHHNTLGNIFPLINITLHLLEKFLIKTDILAHSASTSVLLEKLLFAMLTTLPGCKWFAFGWGKKSKEEPFPV